MFKKKLSQIIFIQVKMALNVLHLMPFTAFQGIASTEPSFRSFAATIGG